MAKKYKQKTGINYDEVFGPCPKTIKLIIYLVAQSERKIFQMDIKSRHLNKEVYVQKPMLKSMKIRS